MQNRVSFDMAVSLLHKLQPLSEIFLKMVLFEAGASLKPSTSLKIKEGFNRSFNGQQEKRREDGVSF